MLIQIFIGSVMMIITTGIHVGGMAIGLRWVIAGVQYRCGRCIGGNALVDCWGARHRHVRDDALRVGGVGGRIPGP